MTARELIEELEKLPGSFQIRVATEDDEGPAGFVETETGECEHKYRRDVESCPYCELIEAEEAAENYWEAWQDAAVYWKEEVRRLRAALREALSFTDHDDVRCKHYGKCQCGLEDLRERCKALESGE